MGASSPSQAAGPRAGAGPGQPAAQPESLAAGGPAHVEGREQRGQQRRGSAGAGTPEQVLGPAAALSEHLVARGSTTKHCNANMLVN